MKTVVYLFSLNKKLSLNLGGKVYSIMDSLDLNQKTNNLNQKKKKP